ncbi:MAG: acetyl-CoA carboxylase biotin carboxyl carrier protein [Sedimentisphaerales bacterium]|nr:acetyl-CoA carboxylase biotin carboxyl carrier protein [Sedimentisphaerales bacterium]
MAGKDADLRRIKRLIKVMKENELVEIEIKHGDDKIALKRAQPQPVVGQPIAAVPVMGHGPAGIPLESFSAGAEEGGRASLAGLTEIKSPIVGTFYATPSPDSDAYVENGSHVEPQTVVCIIEAMKVMNEIKAETSGTIVEVLVSNGQAVEYGQVLFRVKPD